MNLTIFATRRGLAITAWSTFPETHHDKAATCHSLTAWSTSRKTGQPNRTNNEISPDHTTDYTGSKQSWHKYLQSHPSREIALLTTTSLLHRYKQRRDDSKTVLHETAVKKKNIKQTCNFWRAHLNSPKAAARTWKHKHRQQLFLISLRSHFVFATTIDRSRCSDLSVQLCSSARIGMGGVS